MNKTGIRNLLLAAMLFLNGYVSGQDTAVVILADSLPPLHADSQAIRDSMMPDSVRQDTIGKISADSIGIKQVPKPAGLPVKLMKLPSKEFIFYFIIAVFFFFGILRLAYTRYFANIFRVFFNTSLRQSQLTDQLLQAKLPSLLFNIYFCVIGGLYLFLLMNLYGLTTIPADLKFLWISIGGLSGIYLGKYLILKFIGWLSGYRDEADTYIFIVFLINKILSVILMPVVLILAFAEQGIASGAAYISYLIIIIMFFLRYLRSYSLLQHKLKLLRLHFFIYIMGVELVPLLILYKIAENLLKNYVILPIIG